MTKFLNIDLDTKLGGNTPSDVLVSSQKAIKTYVDSKLLEETTRAQGVESGLNTRVSTNEDDIAMNKDEIGTLTTDMSTTKTDITNLKTSVNGQANLISNLQDSKQDKIDNLDTIVAGAAAGATAVQPSAIADMETKTHATATYQPKGDYAFVSSVNAVDTRVSGIEAKIPDSASADNKLATKADLENVGVAIDGTTITKKADGKIQASAVVNQNTGILKSWTGTLAEYNALETKSDDTLYVIIDDDNEGVNVYTKSEVDTLLNNKQDKLVSGTNIKTVNGENLLGSGNIKIESGSGGVPVGAIFTTPRTGTIAGAVEANGGEYNIADYNGEGSIGALLIAGKIAYVSKTEFQTQVTNTGACDSFGWNGAGETYYAWTASSVSVTRAANPVSQDTYYTLSATPAVGDNLYYAAGSVDAAKILEVAPDFSYIVTDLDEGYYNHIRDTTKDIVVTPDPTFLVPKLKPWHVGKSAPVVGNGIAIGITNGTYDRVLGLTGTGSSLPDTYANPDLLGKPVGTIGSGTGPGWQTAELFGISQNPAYSGMITDLSETTNLRVMVQLATGVTDQALETCTSVLADVSVLKYDYVVGFQAPTAANDYTWYRKYKSGWVEQGGISDGDYNTIITLPVIMADNNYYINAYCFYGTSSVATVTVASLNDADITTTTIRLQRRLNGGGSNGQVRWQVSGLAA